MIRPPNFRIDPSAELAHGLNLALLGGGMGTLLAVDSSPYGNHGGLLGFTLPGASVFAPEIGRCGINFASGSGRAITVAAGPQANDVVTVAFWVKPRSGGELAVGRIITNAARQVYFSGGAATLSVYGGSALTTTAALVANTWNHVALRGQNDGTIEWFVNAAANNTGDCGGFSFNPPYTIGNQIGSYGRQMDGVLADLCVWSRHLPLAAIQQLADPSNAPLSGLLVDDAQPAPELLTDVPLVGGWPWWHCTTSAALALTT